MNTDELFSMISVYGWILSIGITLSFCIYFYVKKEKKKFTQWFGYFLISIPFGFFTFVIAIIVFGVLIIYFGMYIMPKVPDRISNKLFKNE